MKTAIGPRPKPRRSALIVDALYVLTLSGLTLGFVLWY